MMFCAKGIACRWFENIGINAVMNNLYGMVPHK
jgi:hypothetical protein